MRDRSGVVMDTQRQVSWWRVGLTAVLSAVIAAPALPYTIDRNNEGYDLMRQITAQIPRPNLLVVLDTSNSMRWDFVGNDLGVDVTGTLPKATWIARCDEPEPTPTPTPTITPTATPTSTSTPTPTA
ncbi:MAG: hypothetical protein AB1625_03955, partial [Acidobacteriota bacterium]